MIDHKAIAASVAEALNGIVRAMRAIPAPKSNPTFERWTREMGEASKHVLMAFGLDPEQLENRAFPVGGGWYVEWTGDQNGEWRAVEKRPSA
jgi:hypothetical protein